MGESLGVLATYDYCTILCQIRTIFLRLHISSFYRNPHSSLLTAAADRSRLFQGTRMVIFGVSRALAVCLSQRRRVGARGPCAEVSGSSNDRLLFIRPPPSSSSSCAIVIKKLRRVANNNSNRHKEDILFLPSLSTETRASQKVFCSLRAIVRASPIN